MKETNGWLDKPKQELPTAAWGQHDDLSERNCQERRMLAWTNVSERIVLTSQGI
jgi:hypothetical protein